MDIASRKVFIGRMKGERRSRRRGESIEFADHRQYVVGDDLRRIDWNIFGRLDRLFMKLFLEEEDLSLHVVIDCSESQACGEPEKFACLQKAAAAIGYIALSNLHRVTFTAIAERGTSDGGAGFQPASGTGSGGVVSSLKNLRGKRRAAEMGAYLCGLETGGSSRFTESAKRIALARTGKGVMVILSDFLFKEGYEQGLTYLAGRGYDLVCIQVLSPQEVDPQLGGDLRLRDVEDDDRTEVTISAPLLKRYKHNLAAYCDQLRLFCARREITHLTVQSDIAMDTLILEYLRSRGVLK
ncbi:DUF58 domain-containing protein [Aetokthonos hydrillicola CCALA 1050]|nr:DUF58 domain-containing protein [Aetokthonos hydrillicola CCALA 1050]